MKKRADRRIIYETYRSWRFIVYCCKSSSDLYLRCRTPQGETHNGEARPGAGSVAALNRTESVNKKAAKGDVVEEARGRTYIFRICTPCGAASSNQGIFCHRYRDLHAKKSNPPSLPRLRVAASPRRGGEHHECSRRQPYLGPGRESGGAQSHPWGDRRREEQLRPPPKRPQISR